MTKIKKKVIKECKYKKKKKRLEWDFLPKLKNWNKKIVI